MSIPGVAVAAFVAVTVLASGCSVSTSGTPRTSAAVSSSSTLPSSAGAVLADADVAARAGGAAKDAFEAIDNYDYRTLDSSLRAALAVSTGTFATQYARTFRGVVESNAIKVKAVQTARLTQVAVQQVVSAGTVRLLGAGNVRVTKAGGTPSTSTFAAVITMTYTGGHWLVSDLAAAPQGTTPPAGTQALAAAVSAPSAAFVAVPAYVRATFDIGFDKALALTTGYLHTGLAARRASLRTELTKDHSDLRSAVTALGVLDATGTMVRVLVVATITKSVNGKQTPTVVREVITVIQVGGHWLAQNLAPVS